MILLRPDGSKIVEYLDGTRITTREEIRTEDVVNEETGEMEGTRECTCQLITVRLFQLTCPYHDHLTGVFSIRRLVTPKYSRQKILLLRRKRKSVFKRLMTLPRQI